MIPTMRRPANRFTERRKMRYCRASPGWASSSRVVGFVPYHGLKNSDDTVGFDGALQLLILRGFHQREVDFRMTRQPRRVGKIGRFSCAVRESHKAVGVSLPLLAASSLRSGMKLDHMPAWVPPSRQFLRLALRLGSA